MVFPKHQLQLFYKLFISVLVLALSACVTTSNSSLTDNADPKVAVERYVQLGLEYIKRNELHRARKHLNRAIEINPNDASANSALGLVYHQEGEYEQAEKLFLVAIESGQNYTRGRSYYGAFLYSAERHQEALDQFLIAANDTEYEGRSQIFSNIALCYLKLDMKQEAIDAYTKTLRLDRTNGRALSGITELLIQIENFDQAKNYYNRLVRLIGDQGMQHSAQSLWLGMRIARHLGSTQQEQTLAGLLNEMYPDSDENMQAIELLNNQAIQLGGNIK
jgi:type IV pilus assembly protein PilF